MLMPLIPSFATAPGEPLPQGDGDILHVFIGFVLDSRGNTVAGATVTVFVAETGFQGNATSGMNGQYQVSVSPYASGYNVSVTAIYKTASITVCHDGPDEHTFTILNLTLPIQTYPIHGMVADPDGGAMEGMPVECVHRDGGTGEVLSIQHAMSDALGLFWFDLSSGWTPSDLVVLSVSGDGFASEVEDNPTSLPKEYGLTLADVEHPQVSASAPPFVEYGGRLAVNATATDNWRVESCTLFYRMESSSVYIPTPMAEIQGRWVAETAELKTVGGGIWYVEASDGQGTARHPSSGAVQFFVNDVNAPEIFHAPFSSFPSHLDLTLSCNATDDQAVEGVSVFVDRFSTGWTEYSMSGGPSYSLTLPALRAIGHVGYYFEATDGTSVTRLPPVGNYSFESIDTLSPTASCQFPLWVDSGGDFVLSISAQDDVGLRNGTLHLQKRGEDGWFTVPLEVVADGFAVCVPRMNETFVLDSVTYFNASVDLYDTSGNALYLPGPDYLDSAGFSAVDTRPPTLKHMELLPAAPLSNVNLTVRAYDDIGVTWCRLFYRFSKISVYTAVTCLPSKTGFYTVLTMPSSGEMEYYFRASDATFNWAVLPLDAPVSVFGFEIKDASGPEMSWTVPASVEAGEAFDLPITSSDPSGVASVAAWCKPQDSTDFLPIQLDWLGGSSYVAKVPAFNKTGDISLLATAYDTFGGSSTLGPVAVRVYDTTPPTIFHDEPVYAMADESAVLCASIFDATSIQTAIVYWATPGSADYDWLSLSEDDGVASDWDGNGATTSGLFGVSVPVGPSPGILNYSFVAYDASANEARLPEEGSFALNVLSYDMPLLYDLTASTTSMDENLTISVRARDNGTIARVFVEISGYWLVNKTLNLTLVSGTTGDGIWTLDLGVPSKPATILYRVCATDGFNNASIPAGTAFRAIAVVDLLDPTLSDLALENISASLPLAFTVRASDNHGVAKVRIQWFLGSEEMMENWGNLDGGDAMDGVYSCTYFPTLEVGWLRYRAIATDLSGRTSYIPSIGWQMTYLPDTSPPSGVSFLLSYGGNYSASEGMKFYAHASDDIGVRSMKLNLGSDRYDMEWGGANGYSAFIPALMEEAELNVTVEAGDANNTVTTSPVVIRVIDMVRPAFGGVNRTTAPAGRGFNISIEVSDDFGVVAASLYLFAPASTTINSSVLTDGVAVFEVPAIAFVGAIECVAYARDTRNHANRFFSIRLADVDPPSIELPFVGPFEAGEDVSIPAFVKDSMGVESAFLTYRLPGSSAYTSLLMEGDGNGNYTVGIPPFIAVGELDYRVIASDGFHTSEEEGFAVVRDTTPPATSVRVFSYGWGSPWRVCVQASDLVSVAPSEMRAGYPDGSFQSFPAFRNSTGPGYVFVVPGAPEPGNCSYSLNITDGTFTVPVLGTVLVADVTAPRLALLEPLQSYLSASSPFVMRVEAFEDHRLDSLNVTYWPPGRAGQTREFEIPQEWAASGLQFELEIEAPMREGTFRYRFVASDGVNAIRFPSEGNLSLSFFDLEVPDGFHNRSVSRVFRGEPFTVRLAVSDDIAVRNATLTYVLPGTDPVKVEGEGFAQDGVCEFIIPGSDDLGKARYWFAVSDGNHTIQVLAGDGKPFEVEVEKDATHEMWVFAALALAVVSMGAVAVFRKR